MTINGHITVRISNNVLPLSDAAVYRLKLEDGKVVDAETVNKGCYGDGSRNFIGKTIEDLSKWSNYDGTGSHPEEYHEVLVGDEWRSFVNVSDVMKTCIAEDELKHKEALAAKIAECSKRAIACENWRWMPGMLVLRYGRVVRASEGDGLFVSDGDANESIGTGSSIGPWQPDLADHATLGALEGLLLKWWSHETILSASLDVISLGLSKAVALVWLLENVPAQPSGDAR